MPSTGCPNALASLSASRVEGMKTPFSIVLMVFRLTPTRSANAAGLGKAMVGTQRVEPVAEPFSHRLFVLRCNS